MHMIPSPTSGKVALQFGALFGISLGVLFFGLLWLALSLGIFPLWGPVLTPVLAFLLAGLFSAKRTGKVSTGALAGLLSGFTSAIVFILLLTVGIAAFGSGARGSSVDPLWGGLVFFLIILSFVMAGIGSGLGALGGLIGKRLSPMVRQPYSSYPPDSSPIQDFQEPSYQGSPSPPTQNVYHLRPLWRIFYAGIYPLISLIAGLSLALKYLGTFDSIAFSLFIICLIVLAVGYNIYYGIRMSMARLVTSPVGVTYYGVGFRIYTPWHQIAGIGKVWKRWMLITGFTFRTPPALMESANQAIQGQVPVIEISRWRRPFYRQYTKLIPLTWFVGNLQNSSLGRDIGWSAPHLLGGIPSASNSMGMDL